MGNIVKSTKYAIKEEYVCIQDIYVLSSVYTIPYIYSYLPVCRSSSRARCRTRSAAGRECSTSCRSPCQCSQLVAVVVVVLVVGVVVVMTLEVVVVTLEVVVLHPVAE